MGLQDNPGGARLFYVQLVFLILAWIFVLLRAYVKIFMLKKVTVDDYIMFTAMVGPSLSVLRTQQLTDEAQLLYQVYGFFALDGIVRGGTGLHRTALNLDTAALALRAWYMCEVLYPAISLLIRSSVGWFLLRIATNKVHRRIIWIDLGIIWVVTVAYFFIMVFQCSPVSYFWMQVYGMEGHCIDPRVVPAATIAHSILSAFSDWILGLLPIFMLWHVKLNKRTKVTISVLLSLGLVGGVALIVRIPYVKILEISQDFLFETM
jgi:hypothetical protein